MMVDYTRVFYHHGRAPSLLVSDLTHDDIYSFTMLTKAEIKDRGKSNWLAKSLVLLQMSWFMMQCIA